MDEFVFFGLAVCITVKKGEKWKMKNIQYQGLISVPLPLLPTGIYISSVLVYPHSPLCLWTGLVPDLVPDLDLAVLYWWVV